MSRELSCILFEVRSGVVLVGLVLVILELMQNCLFRILLQSGRSELEVYMVYIIESFQSFHHLNTGFFSETMWLVKSSVR